MTYIVNESCIRCKYTDCVEVCPVDCFYEGENMLVIDPDECIDCGVCEPECPGRRNQARHRTRPRKVARHQPPILGSLAQHHEEEARTARDAFVNVPDKFAKYFSPNPGEGD